MESLPLLAPSPAPADAAELAGRLATFDIETTDVGPDAEITVAAVRLPGGRVRFWHGDIEGAAGCTLAAGECRALVRDLEALVAGGAALATWNGAGFDFQVLARRSGLARECAQLALGHYDLMFQFLCGQGFRVGLEAVARTLGEGKRAGLKAALAPQAWREGRHEQVMQYLEGDVELTALVAAEALRGRELRWITRAGRVRAWPVPRLLTVAEAERLPLPDTSWMSSPPRREQVTGWIRSAFAGAQASTTG